MRQNLIHLDQRSNDTVETAMLHGLGQVDVKDL
jgi:hypothetical protein